MKFIRKGVLILFFCFLINSPAVAQVPTPPTPSNSSVSPTPPTPIQYNTLYASAYTDLWQINPYTGEFVLIGPIGNQGTDIAFDGTTLYGCNFSQLLLLDPTTGNSTVIGPIGYSDVNALTVGLDGTMYAGTVSGALLKIDKSTGAGTLIGNYGVGFGSSGDLAMRYDNTMYASVTWAGHATDWLVQIDMNTGRAIPIGDIGEWGVYGLDFKDWSLYGVTSDGYLLEIDTVTGKGTRIGTKPANFWGLSTSGPALIGNITAPQDNYTTGPVTIPITATAQYPGGQWVNQVEFYVFYSGMWHSLGNDEFSPYISKWKIPHNLFTQQAMLKIDVVGTDNQNQLQRASYAGGVRRINLEQSIGDPNIIENWVSTRAYLNQRSLTPSGDAKCNVSSIAMILAMDGFINPDYLTMENKANELWQYLLPIPDHTKECTALRRDPVPNAYCSDKITQTEAWTIIKQLINAGHPVIVDSRKGAATSEGHYVAVIGYREESGVHYLIAYDPYGEWRGSLNKFYRNTTESASHVGKWVYYNFENFTTSDVYLFATTSPSGLMNASSEFISSNDTTQLTPPDQISDELRVNVIFNGQETIYPIYLPTVNR
jgi:hypothetical protein